MCAVAPSLAGVPGGAYAGLHYYFCRKGWFAFARSKRDRTRNRGGRFRIPGVSSKLLKAHGWIAYCTFLSVALARLTLGGFEGKRLLLPTGSAS
jgi:hypothetical protein